MWLIKFNIVIFKVLQHWLFADSLAIFKGVKEVLLEIEIQSKTVEESKNMQWPEWTPIFHFKIELIEYSKQI